MRVHPSHLRWPQLLRQIIADSVPPIAARSALVYIDIRSTPVDNPL